MSQFKEGLTYVYGFRPIRSLMRCWHLSACWACRFSVLMPVFANDVLGGGPYTLGFLMTATGMRRADGRAVAGRPQIGGGAGARHSLCHGAVRRGPDCIFVLARAVAVGRLPGRWRASA